MTDSKSRKPVFQDYYTDEDYNEVILKLPDIIAEAERKAGEVLEPTVYEKREIIQVIKEFIKSKNRIVYGGTAMNEAIKKENPDDAIYDDYTFSDIEFYSPTPIPDLVELTNLLYEKGYKFVTGMEARHEETYSIFVNFQGYCDITYVPQRVYNGIKTIEIDGINYVHPHFVIIDLLRMINQPLTAAGQRWEKAFKRMYKLLKHYPLEYYDKSMKIEKNPEEIQSYISRIKTEFMTDKEVQQSCLISGFEAYNFFIRYAIGDRTVEQMARTTFGSNRLDTFITNVPYMELVSVSYRDTVEKLYNFLKTIVENPKELALEEYYPLFQFTGYSVFINYNGKPIARVLQADGYCIPNIKTTRGYMFVSFQYLFMFMLINKFRAHLDKNREMYFNYGIAISNLITARNVYLTKKNLGIINNTPFGEFRITCTGSTVGFLRESQLRIYEKYKQGKQTFRYTPDQFFNQSPESQAKFDPSKHYFRNTSGNKITNPKNLIFKLDENGNIIKDSDRESESSHSEQSNEQELKSNERSNQITSDNQTLNQNSLGNDITTSEMMFGDDLKF